ncbi:restriction endonuclease subunit S [Streptomyces sp. NPDC006288]|uniref:restriction endonuclease subunit S n=1 Tax=Streptomyces sp. NPDC006288 TaxID=3156743 RepID=UPI0033ADCDC4
MSDGWKSVALGDVLRLRSERRHSVATLLSVTADRGVIRQSESGRRDSSSADKSLYWDVHPGDVVYNTMRMWQGVSGIANEGGIVSPAYTVCEPVGKVNSKFLGWLLKDPKLVVKFLNRSQGLVSDTWNLKYSEFEKIGIDLPSLPEQRRIAEILDEIDWQIRLTLDEAQKFGAARNSGLRYMLSEPLASLAETEVSQVKDLIGKASGKFQFVVLGDLIQSIEAGNSPDLEGKPAGEGQWGFLKVSAVGRDGFREKENKRLDDVSLIDSSIEVRPGDLLMTRANTPDLVGMSCVVEETRPGLMLCDKTLRLSLRTGAGSPGFLSHLLRLPEVRRQIEVAATGTSSSMKNISQESIKSLVIPWGAVDVQEGAMKLASGFREGRANFLRDVVKLRSMKKALMGDLLSGKIQVAAPRSSPVPAFTD